MTELVKAGDFQEKIFARIKESIGDLIDEATLKRLVEAAMQEAFFKERIVAGRWNDEKKPPLLVELVDNLMRERIQLAVDNWLKNNSAQVAQIINERFSVGITRLVAQSIDFTLQGPFMDLKMKVEQALLQRP